MRRLCAGMLRGALAAAAVSGCPSATNTPTIDAYGAAAPFDVTVGVAADGSTPCQLACVALARWGCPTFSDCPTVLSNIERDRLEPLPDGAALTCAAIALANRPQDLGIPCNP